MKLLFTAYAAISLLLISANGQTPQLSEASQRMQSGDYLGARAILEALIAQTPQLPEAHNLLGVCLLKLKEPETSVAQFRTAIKLRPQYENAWLNLGSTLFGLQKGTEAVSAFEQLLQINPQSIDAHVALAKIQLSEGKESLAVQHLEKVIQLDPRNTFALANAGLIESRKGNFAKAAGYIGRALAQQPDSQPLELALVELDLKLGKTTEAAAITDRVAQDGALPQPQKQTLAILLLNNGLVEKAVHLIGNDPNLSGSFYNAATARAKQQFVANRFKDTVDILDAISGLRPENAEFHDLLGQALYETGDAKRASDELQQAIRLEPNNPDWYFQLGLVYLKHHTPDLAKVVFNHGLAQLPNSAWLWLGLGLSQNFGDDIAGAQKSVRKALLLDPGLVEGYVVLGDILESEGRLSEAKDVFTQAIEKKPNLYIGYYYCGKVALEAGESQTQQALAFFTKAVDLDPSFAEGHFEKGRALEQSGKLQEALAEYKKSVTLDSSLSQAHYRLALVYRKLGQTRVADNELALFQKAKLKEKDALLQRLDYRIRQP
jgi:tetratricopeptide (TPR) repeat protein